MLGKVLGLDLGDKTLGIAISDVMGIISSAVETFRFEEKDLNAALNRVKFFIEKEGIKEIALGLPLHMSGEESPHSLMCREFKEMIESSIKGVKVFLVDDRWTTKQATRTLLSADMSRNKRKKVIDKMAAQVILDTYLLGRK